MLEEVERRARGLAIVLRVAAAECQLQPVVQDRRRPGHLREHRLRFRFGVDVAVLVDGDRPERTTRNEWERNVDVDVLEVIAFLLEVVEADQVVEALAEAAEELQLLRELLGVQRIERDELGRERNYRAC